VENDVSAEFVHVDQKPCFTIQFKDFTSLHFRSDANNRADREEDARQWLEILEESHVVLWENPIPGWIQLK
jgi:hypothetical protein